MKIIESADGTSFAFDISRGKRLFPDDGPASLLRIVDSRTTACGLVSLTREPVNSGQQVLE